MEARGLSGLGLLLALALPLARKAVLRLVPHLAAGPARSELAFLTLIVGAVRGLGVVRAGIVVVSSGLSTQSSLLVTHDRGKHKQVR